MTDLETICPVCEEDITISSREIALAIQHKKSTGGRTLVSCPECSRALVLPEGIPATEDYIEVWIGNIDDVLCVPMRNDEDIRLPNGFVDNVGKKAWRPGGGGPALAKRPYMFKYGIDPERAWAKMKREKLEPFKIGGN
jgi:hypothetical protein